MYTKFGEDVGPYKRYIYLYILTHCKIREGYVKCLSELFVPHLRPNHIIIRAPICRVEVRVWVANMFSGKTYTARRLNNSRT